MNMLNEIANERILLNKLKVKLDEANSLDEVKAIFKEYLPKEEPKKTEQIRKATWDDPNSWVDPFAQHIPAKPFPGTMSTHYDAPYIGLEKYIQPFSLAQTVKDYQFHAVGKNVVYGELGHQFAIAVGQHILKEGLYSSWLEYSPATCETYFRFRTYIPKVPITGTAPNITKADKWERFK